MYSKTQNRSCCRPKGLTLCTPVSSMRTISPGSTSRTNSAPTMSRAQVSLDSTQPGPPASSGNQTVVLVAPHTPVHAISRQLEDAHVFNLAPVFEFNLRLKGLAPQIKAGEYAIPGHASMADIAAILVSGKSIQHYLTAAEGLTSEMIWHLVKDNPDLVGNPGPVPHEGTLLPETYLFTRGTTRAQLLTRMRKAQAHFLLARWSGRGSAVGPPFRRRASSAGSRLMRSNVMPVDNPARSSR